LEDQGTVKKMKRELHRLEQEGNKARDNIIAKVKEKMNAP